MTFSLVTYSNTPTSLWPLGFSTWMPFIFQTADHDAAAGWVTLDSPIKLSDSQTVDSLLSLSLFPAVSFLSLMWLLQKCLLSWEKSLPLRAFWRNTPALTSLIGPRGQHGWQSKQQRAAATAAVVGDLPFTVFHNDSSCCYQNTSATLPSIILFCIVGDNKFLLGPLFLFFF